MPGLFTTLVTSANALNVYERVLETISNNVNNANTPGYAKQRMSPNPQAFEPASGLAGGILPGELENMRSEYAERAVWRNQHAFGHSDQLTGELASIEPLFDVSGDYGIPGALNQFFQSVSSWSLSANDVVARRAVIERAGSLAQQFNSMGSGLSNASTALDDRIRSAADTINNLAGQVAAINAEIQSDYRNRGNAAIDTRLHNALERLSEYVDFTALEQPDGSFSILLGGQTPLVIGSNHYTFAAATGSGAAVLTDPDGKDITAQVTGGRLKALIDMKNTVLPECSRDLNQLAAGLADGINSLLASGVDTNGQPGAPLFTYNTAGDAAFTLAVTGIAPAELAAAYATAPGGNGNALDFTALANAQQINGMSFTQFYADLAARAGQLLQGAKGDRQTQQDLVVQARSMRADISSVSLDEEAARLIEYQRAYQATARVVTTLNELTQATIDMFR
jgi:flagellar hook-associated protein 1